MTRKIKMAVVLLVGSLFANNAYALDDGVIESAAEIGYPPFSIVGDGGEADGFSVELLKASLEAVDLDVTFYTAPWSQVKEDLANGKIQVLPIVGRTPEREAIYDFTFPYLTFYGAIFARDDDTDIQTLEDIADKEVLVLKGDNAEEYARREKVSNNIIAVETYAEAFSLLSEGKHDAIIAQEYLGNKILKEKGISGVVSAVRLSGFKQEFTFAVKEGDAELLSKLEKGLSAVILDGTFERLQGQWFVGESDLPATPGNGRSYMGPIVVGIIIMGVVVLVLFIAKRRMVGEMVKKTEEKL